MAQGTTLEELQKQEREDKALVAECERRLISAKAALIMTQHAIHNHRDFVPPSPEVYIRMPENEQEPSRTIIRPRRSAVTVLSAEADW